MKGQIPKLFHIIRKKCTPNSNRGLPLTLNPLGTAPILLVNQSRRGEVLGTGWESKMISPSKIDDLF